ncbi:hypothetical protein BaRGS_00005740 [Batillaria attramentaria]|uniref:F-box protein 3 n=1 Tax=Batillaria attramentaria TaxID=370345 RepID=A0ABD0LU51_9CAEN
MACITQKPKVKNILELPPEILLHIFSLLDYKHLCRCAQVCSKFKEVAGDDSLWKLQTWKEFLLHDYQCKDEETWFDVFRSYWVRFGRIHSAEVYRKVRRLWDRLENYLKERDPKMFETLREPAFLGEIQIAEERMKCRFPADLRCSLQIHNGQEMGTGLGLLGCIMISTYFRSEGLLDCASMARSYEDEGDLTGCVPITYCFVSQKSQYMAVTDAGGFKVGEMFYPTPDQSNNDADQFITGNSYLEWFEKFVVDLETDVFPRIDNRIFRFYHEPGCEARTDDCFSVSVSTCFMPDLSTINPPHYFYVYRVTMSMDKNADKRKSCQLESRHWIITDEDGREEHVDGPGVVGEYPVMSPGAEFSWTSCTTFSTTYGNMRGHFTMRNLETGDGVSITCPVYHMKCLPHKIAKDRRQAMLERKKNL